MLSESCVEMYYAILGVLTFSIHILNIIVDHLWQLMYFLCRQIFFFPIDYPCIWNAVFRGCQEDLSAGKDALRRDLYQLLCRQLFLRVWGPLSVPESALSPDLLFAGMVALRRPMSRGWRARRLAGMRGRMHWRHASLPRHLPTRHAEMWHPMFGGPAEHAAAVLRVWGQLSAV